MRMWKGLAAGAALLALAGCASWFQGMAGPPSPGEARTVAEAEIAYTAVANLETTYLQSGKATKAQAATIKALDAALYADVVAGRTAIANNESAGIAVALSLFNQALPKVRAYIGLGGSNVPGGQ